ncbi:restriction endonuclease subunit R [Methanofervidicoccus sp. A16]|nr:restriction endonuclease subunit R [Methanofervidicoccus sp. A16]
MLKPILQSIVEDIDFDSLPGNWNILDTVSFSKDKKLWDFQQESLKNAIKVLYLYFKEDKGDKKRFYQRYDLDEDLEKNLDIRLSRLKKNLSTIIREYYPVENNRIKFYNFINRASFWMATGSGKSLIIVKLVEILKRLMELKEIPERDILILTHREDLLNQLKKHVEEFNQLAGERGFRINFVELTDYERIKRESLIPYLKEITVFYYRSDLIGDEQKEKVIDFRNYENNGNWYIILDEAHKGDKEESKRQMFYSIMSRNGFLFNFSATFTDPRDIITTVYNFNLEKFISEGYGKHIYILKEDMEPFKDRRDYNKVEKQKILLKSLILLTYLKKVREEIKEVAGNIYHEPLMLTLVNTVNFTETKDEKPDLTLFFQEIERVGKGDINKDIFETVKDELLQEFSEDSKLIYEDIPLKVKRDIIKSIKIEDILKYVYNSESFGEVEAITIPGKKQEVVFKLKTSDKPFALIKIGDAVKWIKDNLKGYEVIESYEDKSIFENLDEREDINILMGSRAFYEGWDSNRPNIILFINIGVGKDAKKFIIQSVGRGVRIEPIKGKRRRLRNLYNRGEDGGIYKRIVSIKDGRYLIDSIETLFIFGTRRKVLSEVITTLKMEKEPAKTIQLRKNKDAETYALLIPVFKVSKKKLYQEREIQKFVVSETLFNALREYFTSTDERIPIVENNITPDLLQYIKNSFKDRERYYKIVQDSSIPFKVALQKLINHFNINIEELDRFKVLEEEIIHFKKIKVFLKEEEINELKEKIEKVYKYIDPETRKDELKTMFERGEISIEEYTSEIEKLAKTSKEENFKDLKIKKIVNHYYIPLILSKKEKVDYIRHIIKTKSEVKFIEDLENYLNSRDIDVDWWMFSKIDEYLDEIYIPYYDPDSNKIRRFKPDFIFWLKKGKDYYILFVDPKGIKHTEFEHKVDYFRKIFGDIESPKVFEFDGFKIRVYLYLYTEDRNKLSEGYRKYWIDEVGDIFKILQ